MDMQCLTWQYMSPAQRAAAGVLGFTQKSWDDEEYVPALATAWGLLPQNLRDAAKEVGFTRDAWKAAARETTESDSEDDEGADEEDNQSDNKRRESWLNLDDATLVAATVLGYTRDMWDKDETPPLHGTSWDSLELHQFLAAKVLGFDKGNWPGPAGEEVMLGVYDLKWRDLSEKQRCASMFLGYSPESWDRQEKAPLEDVRWKDLSAAHKAAARLLDHTEDTWDDF